MDDMCCDQEVFVLSMCEAKEENLSSNLSVTTKIIWHLRELHIRHQGLCIHHVLDLQVLGTEFAGKTLLCALSID